LQSIIILKGDQQIPKVLVQWAGIGIENATWEELSYRKQAYHEFNLEDKIDFNGGGNVTQKNNLGVIQEKIVTEKNKFVKEQDHMSSNIVGVV